MNRIDKLASLTKGSNIICDIGCDHGYVVVNALKYHGVKRAIAADVAKEPLNSARINVINNNLDDRVEFVLSNGFSNIESEFDTAIIAGMGGNLIKDILETGINKLANKKIIVEPNNHAEIVREYMVNNGFIITEEYAINDKNHYYEIIVFVNGDAKYSDFEIKYGPILLEAKPSEFVEFYKKKYNRLISYQNNITNEEKRNENTLLVKEYERILGL